MHMIYSAPTSSPPWLGLSFFKSHVIPTQADTAIKLSTTAGAIIGQVLFGWLADKLGRKKMYGVELIIIIIGSFDQATTGSGPSLAMLGPLIFWRAFMGVGAGGGHPLSSAISAEFATVKWRGALECCLCNVRPITLSLCTTANVALGKGLETLQQLWYLSSVSFLLKTLLLARKVQPSVMGSVRLQVIRCGEQSLLSVVRTLFPPDNP
jgi:MFS family permease